MKGSYLVGDVEERFSCGPGPQGWRYTSKTSLGDTLDLTTDTHGLVRRLVADFDGWEVRGGAVGPEVMWVRGEQEHSAVAAGFTGESPAFDLAVSRMLALQPGETTQVTLVELTAPVGAARTVTQGWARTADPEDGVQRFEVADLATAERWLLHVSEQVVVSREGSRPAVLTSLEA
ncbi:MAG: hypothetical protein JWN31_1192 [Frankiales bacterium]|nr:hypothetical protein [Frankiales bacterium]